MRQFCGKTKLEPGIDKGIIIISLFYKKQTSRTGQGIGLTALVSGSEVVNLQIKDIINEIRPVVINKKRTELDARHDIGRENKVTEIMELISTKNIDLMEYLESMLYRVIQRVSMLSKEKFSSDSSVVLKSPISLLRSRHRKMWTAWVLPVSLCACFFVEKWKNCDII